MNTFFSVVIILMMIAGCAERKLEIPPPPSLPTSYEELKRFFTKEGYRIHDIKEEGSIKCTFTLFHPSFVNTYKPMENPSIIDRVCAKIQEEKLVKDYTIVGVLLKAEKEEDLDISLWHFLLYDDALSYEPQHIKEESIGEAEKYIVLYFPLIEFREKKIIMAKALGLLDHFEASWQLLEKQKIEKEEKKVKTPILPKKEEKKKEETILLEEWEW